MQRKFRVIADIDREATERRVEDAHLVARLDHRRAFFEGCQRKLVLEYAPASRREQMRAIAETSIRLREQEGSREDMNAVRTSETAEQVQPLFVQRLQRAERRGEVCAHVGGQCRGEFESEVFGQHDDLRARARRFRDRCGNAHRECSEVLRRTDLPLRESETDIH